MAINLVRRTYIKTLSAILLLPILTAIASPVAVANDDNPSLLEDAEEAYSLAVGSPEADSQSICEAERHLAKVKLFLHQVKDFELNDEDLTRLKEKGGQKCSLTEDFSGPFYVKVTASEDQNQYVRLASAVSGNDLDFILTLEQENGLWTPDRRHFRNRNGTYDYGFCGLNSRYHSNYIQSEDFKDPRNQMEYCYNIFRDKPYRFYGYFIRNKHRNKFVLSEE